jgi:cation transport ATPase
MDRTRTLRTSHTRLVLATALAAAIAAATGPAFAAEGPTARIGVNGMVCAFCAQGIEKRLEALPQTKAVYVNLGQRLVAVEARPGQALTEAVLRKEIADAGYDVTKIEFVSTPVADIRAQMSKAKK